MRLFPVRMVIAGVAMLLAAGLAVALKPAPAPADRRPNLERMIPAEFSGWRIDPSITPIRPSADVQASLDAIYDQIVSRTYVNDRGERVMFVVAYGSSQTDTLKAHRQEVCYAAQGFQISALASAVLDLGQSTIPVTRMVAVAGTRTEPVTYWFTMGDRVVLSRFERMMVQIKYGLSGEIPEGFLVRVSTLSTAPSAAYRMQEDFIKSLLSSIAARDAAKLVGNVL